MDRRLFLAASLAALAGPAELAAQSLGAAPPGLIDEAAFETWRAD
jgi:hypothetical protein